MPCHVAGPVSSGQKTIAAVLKPTLSPPHFSFLLLSFSPPSLSLSLTSSVSLLYLNDILPTPVVVSPTLLTNHLVTFVVRPTVSQDLLVFIFSLFIFNLFINYFFITNFFMFNICILKLYIYRIAKDIKNRGKLMILLS